MSEAADAAGALSKSAQKKQAKMEQAAEKKAAKASSAPVAAEAKPKDDDEEELDPTAYFANRVAALDEFKKNGGVPYPHKFKVDLSVPEFVHRFSGLADGERNDRCRPLAFNTLAPNTQQHRCGHCRAHLEQALERAEVGVLRPPRRRQQGAGDGRCRL